MTYLPDSILGISVPTDQWITVSGKGARPVGIAAGVGIVLIIIQLTSFLLYLPIFIVTKRSGANVGIKREAAIARKIALLVFTNLIFFIFRICHRTDSYPEFNLDEMNGEEFLAECQFKKS